MDIHKIVITIAISLKSVVKVYSRILLAFKKENSYKSRLTRRNKQPKFIHKTKGKNELLLITIHFNLPSATSRRPRGQLASCAFKLRFPSRLRPIQARKMNLRA